MQGFFPESAMISKKTSKSLLPKCGACGLSKTCNSPKVPPYGKGTRCILILGEAPGRDEDDTGQVYAGNSGTYLREVMKANSIDLERDCIRSNAIICRPEKNRDPSLAEIGYCAPNLTKLLREVQPKLIIPLGSAATTAILSPYVKNDSSSVMTWAGNQIPLQPGNTWVTPNYHPAFVIRDRDAGKTAVDVLFRKYIKKAIRLCNDRPWNPVPDYESEVQVIYDEHKVVEHLRWMVNNLAPISFDYEMNCLKPEYPKSQIYSAAVCWNGKRTIAFPWTTKTAKAMSKLLRSSAPKIGSNIKFEERWTRYKLGHPVTNWVHDTCLAAHQIDNRPNITSLKFQALALLGFPIYNDHIESLLKNDGDSLYNQIHEIEIGQLLKYNGLDALLSFKVAEIQRKCMGLGDLAKGITMQWNANALV